MRQITRALLPGRDGSSHGETERTWGDLVRFRHVTALSQHPVNTSQHDSGREKPHGPQSLAIIRRFTGVKTQDRIKTGAGAVLPNSQNGIGPRGRGRRSGL